MTTADKVRHIGFTNIVDDRKKTKIAVTKVVVTRAPKSGEVAVTGRGGGGKKCRALDLNTMASYIPVIGIADERWNVSAARNRRHRLLLLTTDVLALVSRR